MNDLKQGINMLENDFTLQILPLEKQIPSTLKLFCKS